MNFLMNLVINAKVRLSNNKSDCKKLLEEIKEKRDNLQFGIKETGSFAAAPNALIDVSHS